MTVLSTTQIVVGIKRVSMYKVEGINMHYIDVCYNASLSIFKLHCYRH